MSRAIACLLFICFGLSTFCQYNKSGFLPVTKQDYLLISKRERTAAWLLFGVGGTMFLGALAIGTEKANPSPETAVILGGLGVLSVSASIPLFILSGKNKRKARAAPVARM